MSDQVVPEIHEMADELKCAGWTPKTSAIWRAPNGTLHLGPAGAWRKMKRLQSAEPRDVARDRIIRRGMNLRVEIEQTFIDCAAWNDHVRKPDEDPIDCDPDGELRRVADGLDRMLAREASLPAGYRGPIEPGLYVPEAVRKVE